MADQPAGPNGAPSASLPARAARAGRAALRYCRLVRLAHTVFALPFALAGLALASLETPFRWHVLLWVLVAMVAARSAAMGFNRVVDRRYDALNPRTCGRELPRGLISTPAAWAFVVVCSALFIAAAWALNPLCGWLSPPALAVLFFYSLTKRFTWTSQFFLGLSLAIAPAGAWMAQTGGFDWRPAALAAAVLLWVAGFDILYACLDIDFDREHGLHSVPGRWGLRGAIRIARALHAAAAVLIVGLYWLFPLGPVYLAGAVVVVAVLALEDSMVRHDDLSRAMAAFNLNGVVSILFFLAVLAGILWR